MKLHRQSTIRSIHDAENNDEIVGYGPRHSHVAMGASCPSCDARAGGQCKADGEFLPALTVHAERMEAWL